MIYLSQLINKIAYHNGKPFGKITDMAIIENRQNPPIAKFEIRQKKKKITVSPHTITYQNNNFTIITPQISSLPYDNKDFYLVEDLLDKQIIHVDGKRLVRVNDILLDDTDQLKVIGIDIGIAGIFRRLGLGKVATPTKILPWGLIEAFDYDTGNIRIKLTQNNLSALHPADIADILEEAGSKERLGIITSLEASKAARVIEETDDETQANILEQLGNAPFKEIINKMHISEIADIFSHLNPTKIKEIQAILGAEKTQHVKKILSYPDDVAGGLMRLSFFSTDVETTIKEIIKRLKPLSSIPEIILVTNGNEKLSGIIKSKDIIRFDPEVKARDIITDKKYVYANASSEKIMKLFSQYNLRVLPVIDKDKKPIGIVVI